MKAFVTGSTGFIGSRLVKELLQRGDQVNALVRSEKGAAELKALGAQPVMGDIVDTETMRGGQGQPGMYGCEVVFHLAAWYKLGGRDWKTAEKINIQGTRNVLGLAHELGIPKIIYTSTVAVFGDTHGATPDESYASPEEPFLTEYDRTKWLAHYKVAVPFIEKGAPVIIVMPGGVYGPGDPSLIGDFMRLFHKGLLPVLPGPELTLTFAHVDDIAAGHILAAEKGKAGESYLLTGPALSIGEVINLWAQLTGKRAPAIRIPGRWIKPLAPVARLLSSILPLPAIFSYDACVIQGATYLGRSDKARAELGWQTRPLEEGMRATLAAMGT